MTRSVAFLVIAALLVGCSSSSTEPPTFSPSSSASDAFANLDSVTWPATETDVLALFRRMPAKIGDHERAQMYMSTFGATYGGANPNTADVTTYAMTTQEAGIQTPAADRLGELRRLLSDAPNAQEEASSTGGSTASAYLAVVAPMNPSRPTDVRHLVYWIPPERSWVYAVGTKDVDDRDTVLAAMIEAAGASGLPPPKDEAPLGLDTVAWPTDAAGAKALLAAMPASIADLPKGQIQYGTVLTYGEGATGNEPVMIMTDTVPPDHSVDIAQMPAVMIGMGYPVKRMESSNDDPATPLAWLEAEVGSPAPGMTGGYAIAWAPTDGSVVYLVVAQTADLRAAVIEAMAASITAGKV